MSKLKPKGKQRLVYQGRIVAIEEQDMTGGGKEITFEKAVRAPGVRLLVARDNEVLLTKEFRYNLHDYDYRLAGGKVFNKLEDYLKAREDIDAINKAIEQAVITEAREELGVNVTEQEHFYTSKAGATIEWDLHYVIVSSFKELNEQTLEHGEDIEPLWVSIEEAREMCLNGDIGEERSAMTLFRYLYTISG